MNIKRFQNDIDLLAQEGATLPPYERSIVRSFVQHARLLLRTLYGIKAECSDAKLAALATARKARAAKLEALAGARKASAGRREAAKAGA